jgi:hypothetical protein
MQKGPIEYFLRTADKKIEENTYITKDALLDPHHTHFLLVDNAELNKFSGEIKFRTELEEKVRNYSKDGRDKAPLVLLVVGGGPNTYSTCLETVKAKQPVVFVEVNTFNCVQFLFGSLIEILKLI